MKVLFDLDLHDYDPLGQAFVRPSARCIAIRDGRVAMVHSRQYDYYKFPGGGIEPGETPEEALIRETREEAGLEVVSCREYGLVPRRQRSDRSGCSIFVQDNFYYLCEVSPRRLPQDLDRYEAEEGFALEFVDPDTAISVNRTKDHGPKDQTMLEREARVLELLKAQGYFR